ncbi:SAM-dependent methyltransferase [Catenulispora sp. GAS73]|uniref:class I SAM-dependent methyltransferase n=1 Tax=Catenulispora sp. GAS73 TaxID=3156269 RepID=UPI0035113538
MRSFYDDMADDYHLMFQDWDISMEYQASLLSAVIEAGTKRSAGRVLDCSCGIGTQAIGLARLGGASMIGTDLSPRAATRAAREATARGVSLPTAAADMRALPFAEGVFDVVLSADNSVTHLLTPDALTAGLAEMRRVLRPDGLLILTVRDYDELRAKRPTTTSPQVSEQEAGRAIAFQLWHWHPDGERYDMEHFQLAPSGGDKWDVRVRRATSWALTRAQLGESATAVGFRDVQWIEPPDSGYYQPILTAHR